MAFKGIGWGIIFVITAVIYSAIPTYLIIRFWVWLNSFPVYTLSLFMLFLWIVAIIIVLIYIVAMIRAFIQRNNKEGLGIPKGVKGFGLVSSIIVVSFMLIWYFIFNQIAFFSMIPPPP
ncbi:MAG: hypothetical protein CEE43_15750 [Promethearchaeota archaeon Loki_b32]|nr:MAG: hypothetical protein CEE43_15750 [Candidatus Lokiarchaeota archaeon Loki_b32]